MNVEKDWLFRTIVLMMVAAMITALFFDGISHRGSAATAQRATLVTSTLAGGTGAYAPKTRTFVVTTVPLLVHEQAATFDYLKQDFSPKGMLATKEVWGFSPNSFTVYAGEVLGFFGIVGAGRTEVARCLFGLDPFDSGAIRLEGKPVHFRSAAEAVRRAPVRRASCDRATRRPIA